jgi:hypothetical protein
VTIQVNSVESLFLITVFLAISILIMELIANKKKMYIRIFKRFSIVGISFCQGFLFATLLNLFLELSNNFSQSVFGKTTIVIDTTIFVGIFAFLYYFLIIDRYYGVKIIVQNLWKKDQKKEIICEELEHFLNSTLLKGKIKFFEFTDDFSSFNAQYVKPNTIYLGKDLNEKTSISERKFVIAHEVSHSLSRYTSKIPLFLLISAGIVLALNLLQILTYQNFIIFIIFQFLFFFLSLYFVHYIFWKEEFFADENAIKITADVKSGISFFHKADSIANELYGTEKEPDYGFFNLLLFDHPLTKERIKKIRNLDK